MSAVRAKEYKPVKVILDDYESQGVFEMNKSLGGEEDASDSNPSANNEKVKLGSNQIYGK